MIRTKGEGNTRWYHRLFFTLLRPRKQWVMHEDSPGMKVLVVRTWIGRLLRNPEFSSVGETHWQDHHSLPPLLETKVSNELKVKEFTHAGMAFPCHPETCCCHSHELWLGNVLVTQGSKDYCDGVAAVLKAWKKGKK